MILPSLSDRTILCLQAGEVNTGAFDPFEVLIARAKDAGAWVHIDGAFGLWARASASTRHLAQGAEGADSWTTDGHKWLNVPYDSAMAICREPSHLAETMNSDADYATASLDAQKNITLEFSRRARGIAVWAALRTLGKAGVDELVARHCRQARRLAEGLRQAGFEILNRVVLNQVLFRSETDEATRAIREAAEASGKIDRFLHRETPPNRAPPPPIRSASIFPGPTALRWTPSPICTAHAGIRRPRSTHPGSWPGKGAVSSKSKSRFARGFSGRSEPSRFPVIALFRPKNSWH